MGNSKEGIQIFLSYAREDRETVEILYQNLSAAGFKPWMDTRDILPGEVWMESIRSAIEHSDFFLACLSPNSVNKRGVLQREFKAALDTWQGMLESDIYFIPVKLADCAVPDSMRKFQWVELFLEDGFSLLEEALREGSERRNTGSLPVPANLRAPARPKYHKPDIKDLLVHARSRPVPLLGSILGLFLAFTGLPWAFNNYVYDVKPPDIPQTCQASPDPVRVGLSRLSECSSSFQDQLAASWVGDAVETSIIPQSFQTSDQARKLVNYDIIVWGACETAETEDAELTFELITSRKPYGVYEPSSLQVSGGLNELSRAGLALMSYQRGDYLDAAGLFSSLRAVVDSTIVGLFESNSLLFAERYDEAIASYQSLAQAGDLHSAAAYNNMGIAYFNKDADLGLDQFDKSIELAEDQQATEIEALALVNRSQFFRVRTNWENAYEDCSASLGLNGQSALPYTCMASYNIMYYRYSSILGLLPLNEIDRNLSEAEKYEDAPALLNYMRGYWYLNQFWKRKQEAVDSYVTFLADMENKACLRVDHELIANSVDTIQQLTSQ